MIDISNCINSIQGYEQDWCNNPQLWFDCSSVFSYIGETQGYLFH